MPCFLNCCTLIYLLLFISTLFFFVLNCLRLFFLTRCLNEVIRHNSSVDSLWWSRTIDCFMIMEIPLWFVYFDCLLQDTQIFWLNRINRIGRCEAVLWALQLVACLSTHTSDDFFLPIKVKISMNQNYVVISGDRDSLLKVQAGW